MTEFTRPTPDAAFAIAHPGYRVRALFRGHLLADSGSARIVRQANQPDRYFFPTEDVEMVVLTPTGFTREFADLGVARFYSIHRDGAVLEHAAWCFEEPTAAAEDLRGLMTFDLDIVHIEEGEEEDRVWDAEARRMGEYIRHTDSGSGLSQAEHWSPNAALPAEDDEGDEDIFTRGSPT